MSDRILITGGAGFIGSHLSDELLNAGYQVRVLDNLSPQVHGDDVHGDDVHGEDNSRGRPPYLSDEVELVVGDVRDDETVRSALQGVDAVYHFAAAVGVGQSMYQISHYTSVNNLGTAVLLDALADHPVKRLIVASSMSIYGEGTYCGRSGLDLRVGPRSLSRLRQGDWEVYDSSGRLLAPVPTPEEAPAMSTSIYALSKHDQERMCLMVGEAYSIPTVALRFFNVYGPRQALSNPYTGVLAIFASRYLKGESPLIYEDGLQRRDFVNVHDVARACRLALESEAAVGEVFNVGSGRSTTVLEVAAEMARVLAREDIEPEITGRYRVGDIRHCFADISRASQLLGYEPQVSFEEGLQELAEWLDGQVMEQDVPAANQELEQRGLVV
jgi:dTDP-L-rhamnose 4-epimerase